MSRSTSYARVSVRVLTAGIALGACAFEGHAHAADRYVAPGGSDGSDGAQGAPWATLQRAADSAQPGDVVHVADGSYQGMYVETVATEAQPLVFVADGAGAIIDAENPVTDDGINIENSAWVTVEGFVVDGMGRAGIRVVESPHVTVRGNVARNNFKWGILTGCSEDIVIEGNEASGSADEHGIYHSNSADRAVIRDNVVHDNNANGIHINSDLETACEGIDFDGIISEILVERNVIWNQGNGGGSGINCDGVQDSVFRNNLIFEAHASGMSFYRIDGAEGARGNTVMNNTIVVAGDGRWALNFTDGSTGGFVRNNILLGPSNVRGATRADAESIAGLDSDYNIVSTPLSADGDETLLDLADWQLLGFDAHSAVADAGVVFMNAGASDFHLTEASPARDAGDPVNYAVDDLDGNGRPAGDAADIGAYEYGGVPTTSSTGAGPGAGGGGPGDGDGDGDGTGSGAGDGGASAAPGSGPGATGTPSASGAGTAGDGDGDGGGDATSNGGTDDGCGCRIEASAAPGTGLDRLAPMAILAGLAGRVARRRSRRIPTGSRSLT